MKTLVSILTLCLLIGMKCKDEPAMQCKSVQGTFKADVEIHKTTPTLFLNGSGAVVNFNNDLNFTLTSNLLTVDGGNLSLGANSLLGTGSIGATGTRFTKGWFTDLEITSLPTISGTSIFASPTFTGTMTTPAIRLGSTLLTPTGTEINKLHGLTSTTAELNYSSGLAGNIQTLLNAKLPTNNPTLTGTVTLPGNIVISQLPRDYTPDTLITFVNGKMYWALASDLSNEIYPVDPPVTPSSTAKYVAVNGNNSNPGTYALPWATWQYALNQLTSDDTLYVRGGTYTPAQTYSGGRYCGARMVSRNGSSGHLICVFAYPGETPIMDCSNVIHDGAKAGLMVEYSSYIKFKGLTVMYAHENATVNDGPADGWYIADATNITMEECIVTRCGYGFTTGYGSSDNIYFTNCDAYDNADLQFGAVSSGGKGGYCDGFGVHNLGAGKHVYFSNCRAWNNSDDGWDCTSSNGYITYDRCWAFENGHTSGNWPAAIGITGDGDGFKTGVIPGAKEAGVQRAYTNCVAFSNDLMGFDESADYSAVADMHVYNCISYGNGNIGFGFYQLAGSGIVTIANCISYSNATNTNLRASVVKTTNSWQVATVTNADFVSLTPSGVTSPRTAGALTVLTFLHLATGSDCIHVGTNMSITYDCDNKSWYNPPSLGAFEY